MKSIITEDKAGRGKPFPKLMVGGSGRIVLFAEEGVGTGLGSTGNPEPYKIGYYSCEWVMGQFKDFNGSITLSND